MRITKGYDITPRGHHSIAQNSTGSPGVNKSRTKVVLYRGTYKGVPYSIIQNIKNITGSPGVNKSRTKVSYLLRFIRK